MHGELIFHNSIGGGERRVPGNAASVDEKTLTWEIHDRELSHDEVAEISRELAALHRAGSTVSLMFVDPGPLLDEVESGPRIDFGESAPFTCRILDVDLERGVVRLERSL